MQNPDLQVTEDELLEIESLAVELANWAGAEATRSLLTDLDISYKPRGPQRRLRSKTDPGDPVSEMDKALEKELRSRIRDKFPQHAILGEEEETLPEDETEWVWVIDPIDGTSNFVNRFPLFAVSIGVLYRAVPVVGAIWCSSTHLLGSGVYHSYIGGKLYLDDREVAPPPAQVKRRLGAAPGGSLGSTESWDNRVTGSAAFELAMVSAKVFTSVPLWSLSIWDVAAGICLARSAGLEVWIKTKDDWEMFEQLQPGFRDAETKDARDQSLRYWRAPLVVGTSDATSVWRKKSERVLGWQGRFRRRLRKFVSV